MPFAEVTVPTQDLQNRAFGRMLRQFQNSPVLLQILWALISEIQILSDAITAVIQGRMPADAVGVNLDAIGLIVGQGRDLIDYNTIIYANSDNASFGSDGALAWVLNAPLYTSGQAEDPMFRILIQAKVFRNFCQCGSLTEIQNMILLAFGINVSFMPAVTGLGDMVLIHPMDTPEYILYFLMNETSNSQVDDLYYPPYPAGMNIVGEMPMSPEMAITDQVGRGSDQGNASVLYTF